MSDINLVIRYDNGNIDAVAKETEKKLKKTGEKSGEEFSSEFSKGLDSLIPSVAQVGAAVAAIGAVTVFKSVRAAIEQENAVNRLAGSLRAAGDLSEEALTDLQDFASELQKISTIGDETTLAMLSLAKGFGASNEQAKQIAAIAADLSVGIGVSFESAVRLASKTLGGFAGELGESIPALKNLTQEQLRNGEGLTILAEKYRGLGQNELNTFSGSLDKTSNAFGDLLEEIGFFITKNPILIDVLQKSADGLKSFSDGLAGIRELTGLTDKPVTELGKLEESIAANVDKQQLWIESLKDLKDGNFFGFISKGDQATIDRLGPQIEKITQTIADQIGKRKELLATQKDSTAANNKEVESVEKQLTAMQLFAAAKVTNEQVIRDQERLRFEALSELRERDIISQSEYELQRAEITRQSAEQIAQIKRAERDRSVENSRAITAATINSFKDIRVSTVALGKDLQTLSVKGFGNAAKNIGAALAKGESVNDAFVESAKATASEAASAFGDYYVKLGIVRIAAGEPGGAGVFAGGLALKAVSGALGAGGSSSSSSGGGSSFSSGGFELADDTIDEGFANTEAISQEPQTVVNVTVEGNSFGNEEFTRQIVESIGDEGGKQGLVFNNFQTA